MRPYILCLLWYFCIFNYSAASTFITGQDGVWTDSSSWNNDHVGNALEGDTIIIRHYIRLYNNLSFTNCYIQIDDFGILCGHDSVFLHHSQLWNYGKFVTDYLLLESSQWYCEYGLWNTQYFITGDSTSEFVSIHCAGDTAWQFICLEPDPPPPPQPVLHIAVYPNPALGQFFIESEIPAGHSQVILIIYDVWGRKIESVFIPVNKSTLTILTINWSPGVYFLRFNQGETILQQDKIVNVR